MHIAIARLIAVKDNMLGSIVTEKYVVAYNQILTTEQERTGVDLSGISFGTTNCYETAKRHGTTRDC